MLGLTDPNAYHLGVDIGTSFTAAALSRRGGVELGVFGHSDVVVPSVLYSVPDGTWLVGASAVRRAVDAPERIVREFKRRFGDPTPVILGGVTHSIELLTGRLLGHTVAEVARREGRRPEVVTLTVPASWSVYKLDLMRQSARLAGLDESAVGLLPEPVAAAYHYAATERLEPESLLAVYDLGGGTFDATVVRRTGDTFVVVGQPEGIERLGGVDFDEAVFAHVAGHLDGALEDLDPDDPDSLAAVARIRRECVAAKEALSSDTEATIEVTLPGRQHRVRLVRSEFEDMIRPSLDQSLDALDRALVSAAAEPSELRSVLLVGGSSRIPLVGAMVTERLGRPVSVDTSPKHAVALGAARAAAAKATPTAAPRQRPAEPTPPTPPPPPPPVYIPPPPVYRPAPPPFANRAGPQPSAPAKERLPRTTRVVRGLALAAIALGVVLHFLGANEISNFAEAADDGPNDGPLLVGVSGLAIAYLFLVVFSMFLGAAPLAFGGIARRPKPRVVVGVVLLLLAGIELIIAGTRAWNLVNDFETDSLVFHRDALAPGIAIDLVVVAVLGTSAVLVLTRRGRAAAVVAAVSLLGSIVLYVIAVPDLTRLSGQEFWLIPGALFAAAGAALGLLIPDVPVVSPDAPDAAGRRPAGP